jgi:hypothetical protein
MKNQDDLTPIGRLRRALEHLEVVFERAAQLPADRDLREVLDPAKEAAFIRRHLGDRRRTPRP